MKGLRITTLILLVCLVLPFAACGSNSDKENSKAETDINTKETDTADVDNADSADDVMPEGELWVVIPDSFYLDTIPAESNPITEELGVDASDIELSLLYSNEEDGSSIVFSIVNKENDYRTVEELKKSVRNDIQKHGEMIEEDLRTLIPNAEVTQCYYIEVEGAPGSITEFNYSVAGFDVTVQELQIETNDTVFTWTFTDWSGTHGDEFEESINSAYFSTETNAAELYEQLLEEQKAAAEMEIEQDTEDESSWELRISIPDSFYRADTDAGEVYYQMDGTTLGAFPVDFGDWTYEELEYFISIMDEEAMEAIMGQEIDDFQHMLKNDIQLVSFKIDKAEEGVAYGIMGPAPKSSIWMLIDVTGDKEDLFWELVDTVEIY